MKRYIHISKDDIKEKINIYFDTSFKLIKVIQYMKQIKSIINLTDEEINIIEKAEEIIANKGALLEDLLEDKNINFFNLLYHKTNGFAICSVLFLFFVNIRQNQTHKRIYSAEIK